MPEASAVTVPPPSTGTQPLRPARVSVVIACYNYGHFLEQCVESALSQEDVCVDVTIVDDASTDDSAAVAEDLARRHGVQVRRHTQNAGYIASYNELLGAAEGEFVVKLDADDALPTGALARATTLLRREPEVGFVYGRPYHFATGEPLPRAGRVRDWQVWPGHTWLERRCRTATNCISNPEVVMRRSVLQEVGFFRPQLKHTCDFELWLRLAAAADVGRVRGPYQGCYRVHPESMQRTVNAGVMADIVGRRDAFRTFFSDLQWPEQDARRLEGLALSEVGRQALDAACRAYDRGRVEEGLQEELIAVAATCDTGYQRSPEWRALQRRRRVGPRRAQYLPPFFLRAVQRRLQEEVGRLRWQATGW